MSPPNQTDPRYGSEGPNPSKVLIMLEDRHAVRFTITYGIDRNPEYVIPSIPTVDYQASKTPTPGIPLSAIISISSSATMQTPIEFYPPGTRVAMEHLMAGRAMG